MKGATSEKAVPAGAAMRCPRCESANTKFCYYNNYSLSQPRHFCKTCRRYWTRGGALRNVPIGGGCRKSKKLIKPSFPADVIGPGLSPAMDFHLSPPSSLHRQLPAPAPSWLAAPDLGGAIQQITSTNNNSNNISTIESLSCMNQDLHWKLQQQRLSLLFSKDHHSVNVPKDSSFATVPDLVQQPSSGDVAATVWFSGNSYANHVATAAGGGAGNNVGTTTTVSNWNINNGFEAWSHDNHHFSTV